MDSDDGHNLTKITNNNEYACTAMRCGVKAGLALPAATVS
jgi:hypothetical protein